MNESQISIRPLNDWLLVKMDPVAVMSGTIFLPTNPSRIRTGTVIRSGPGRWPKRGVQRTATGVEAGDKVAFFRENLEHQAGKQLSGTLAEVGEDLAMLRVNDVLYVMDDERKSRS